MERKARRCFELEEDPSFWRDNSVQVSTTSRGEIIEVNQVLVRVRPLNSKVISVKGQKRCVRQDSSQSITWMGHQESRFTFDHVVDEKNCLMWLEYRWWITVWLDIIAACLPLDKLAVERHIPCWET